MAVSKRKILATVAIPTYNGQDYLDDLLKAVFNQEFEGSFEVIVVDSGSTDKTLSIIEKHKKVSLHQIPNSEFGHGKTRNLAAKLAKGEFIVFLSQDAVPANNKWLESMIEPFYISKDVFCVLGKQTPRAFADATTKREVSLVFNSLGPDHSIMLHRGKSLFSGQEIAQKLTFLSDVNSAVRLDYLKNKIPYQDVKYSEDQLLGIDVLNAGFLKAYAPHSNVFHSNEYPLFQYYYRRIDEFSAVQKYLKVKSESRILSLIKLTIKSTLQDFVFIIRDKDYSLAQKLKNFIESPIRNTLKSVASFKVGTGKNKSHDSLEERNRS